MKKIIHVIGSLSSGGAETLIKDYALNINKDKFNFILIVTGEQKETINHKILIDHNIKIIYLGEIIPFRRKLNIFKRICNKIARVYKFKEIIEVEKPDVIHTHLGVNEYISLTNTANIKLFHTLHSEVSILFRKTKFIYKKTTEYCIQKKGMTLIALHEGMQTEAQKLFNTKECLVLNNAIDLNRFRSNKKNEVVMKQELGVPQESFVIGHVGSFSESKNQSFLLELLLKVKRKKTNAVLILVGTGKMEEAIKNRTKQLGLENSTYFLGLREDIPDIMNVFDVFVFPSTFEGFGNVMLEAQAVGVKCVASNNVPKSTKVTNNVSYVKLDDSLEKWVNEILKKPIEKIETYDIEKYDIKNVIEKLESIYQSTSD